MIYEPPPQQIRHGAIAVAAPFSVRINKYRQASTRSGNDRNDYEPAATMWGTNRELSHWVLRGDLLADTALFNLIE